MAEIIDFSNKAQMKMNNEFQSQMRFDGSVDKFQGNFNMFHLNNIDSASTSAFNNGNGNGIDTLTGMPNGHWSNYMNTAYSCGTNPFNTSTFGLDGNNTSYGHKIRGFSEMSKETNKYRGGGFM